ncbi:dynamin-like GTPase mgm1 [Zygosaccharomyces mellis]|uniref:dynamin GTPase n=1 Tax=Zygosaccharomyces mellis TaxID=42258 RepID=A0A4C2ECL6_9SACH|nr:dynamin-like GTPase mgm1 [Zygosaccharomyces mellis]
MRLHVQIAQTTSLTMSNRYTSCVRSITFVTLSIRIFKAIGGFSKVNMAKALQNQLPGRCIRLVSSSIISPSIPALRKCRTSQRWLSMRAISIPPISNNNKLFYHSYARPSPFQFRMQFFHNTLNLSSKRFASMFPNIISKAIKIPTYVGGGMAAAGSYIAYKANETNTFIHGKWDQFRDFAGNVKDRFGDVLPDGAVTGSGASSNNNGNNGGSGDGSGDGDLMSAAASLFSDNDNERTKVAHEDDEDDEDDGLDEDNTQDEMLNLMKQMIEIRSLLNKIDSNSAHLSLPSIVVIGSQSSGKSSVLESIVGREFLPKGSNMVTRRPIELTLVNTPNSKEITADFPLLRLYNLTNFKEVKKILMESNMAVPTTEAISEDPIQLTIKSSRVPDLSLVDLPGYIQIEAADQPMELKGKIRQLCDKYLADPNIILAISSADVDLANSAALRAAKAADPQGLRTIGVITKLDLVSPEVGHSILTNKKYPLKMGYVGVITKAPGLGKSHLGLFSSRSGSEGKVPQSATIEPQQVAVREFEKSYLREHKKQFNDCQVSTKKLREKLIKILEISMSNALEPTSMLIQQELDDTSYLFKVEFNDRQLTPKSYLLNNVDILKLGIKEFQEKFNRNELKSILKADLDQRVLDFLATRYWKDENLQELSSKINNDDEILYWHKKLELASSSLTKVGVGRLSTMLVTNAILKELENVLQETQLKNHDLIKELVTNTAVNVLNAKYYATADQVENCIKPFKYEIDLDSRDWNIAREHSVLLMKEEMRQCNEKFQVIKNSIGSKKLQQVMAYLHRDPNKTETLGMSKLLLERGSEALFLSKRLQILGFRLQLLKNKCSSVVEKDQCPEVFLNAVSDKLTSTAVLFLNVELLSDFFYNFPIELDRKLNNLSEEQVEMFAKEDPRIARHIELQKRKELLDLALEKIDSILVFKKSYKGVSKKITP